MQAHIFKLRVYLIQSIPFKTGVQLLRSVLGVLRAFDLANNVVSLAEEGVPFVQYGLLLVLQVIPLGNTVLGLERRAS